MFDENSQAILTMKAMLATVLLASAYAVWAASRESRQAPKAPLDRRPYLAARLGLLAIGVAVSCAAYATADHLVLPLLKELIGPPVVIDTDTPSLVGQQLISTLVSFCLVVACVGLVIAKHKQPHPMDGYWLLNPLSAILGMATYSVVALNVFAYMPTYFYWGFSMKFIQMFCIPTLGARAYGAIVSTST